MARFANCGSGLWLEFNAAKDDIRCRCNRCHDRWCIPCQTERACRMRETVARLIDAHHPRFLTLTLRHSDTPLADQITRLYVSFALFRRRAAWKSHVKGGAAFLELKLSEKTGLWHVHLHCLITGSFWDQREISTEWHAVTGDSSIVDVRRISSSEDAARYVTKYVTKPIDSTVYRDTNRLDEAIISFRGRRLCMTFGSWRSEKLDDVPDDDQEWHGLGRLDCLVTKARAGDTDALRWVEGARRKWPLLIAMMGMPPPAPQATAP